MSQTTAHRSHFTTSPRSSEHTQFTYRLAAASSAKSTPRRQPQLHRDVFPFSSTHADPRALYLRSSKPDAGEDAFFASTVGGNRHRVAFGVADGVGGWQASGVDPSYFSHGLCGYMARTAYTLQGLQRKDVGTVTPRDLLQVAYNAVIADEGIRAGGSTASLGVVDGQGMLETANLGDSGYLIISPGRIAFRSSPQTHDFNTPYQLSKIPHDLYLQRAIFGGGSERHDDQPSDADTHRHNLQHGDVIIFGTDGVWDNVSAQETLETVTKVMHDHNYWTSQAQSSPSSSSKPNETHLNGPLISSIPHQPTATTNPPFLPSLIATALTHAAKTASLNTRRNGPFAKEVQRRFPHERFRGGKIDDIAVVACVAVRENEAAKAKL